MHDADEYRTLLHAVLARAEQIVACLPVAHRSEAAEVLGFLKTYGCEGYPSGRAKDFSIGPWIVRGGMPKRQHEGVTIILCFSDDVRPVELPPHSQSVIPGDCFHTDQVICLYNADHWSLTELALTALHEGRHARHRIGPTLAGLPPLDHADVHETNTWMFMLNALGFWGGTALDAAVQQEITWLGRQPLAPEHPGQITFAESRCYWPELDQVFGPVQHADARTLRQRLVSVLANMLYWPRRDSSLSAEQVCHSLVSCLYALAD